MGTVKLQRDARCSHVLARLYFREGDPVGGACCRVCRCSLGSRPGSLVSHCAQGKIPGASFELLKVSVKKKGKRPVLTVCTPTI
jgi:hypothetical protein